MAAGGSSSTEPKLPWPSSSGLPIPIIGSGALLDYGRFGFTGEPVARTSIVAGADLVLFSGDKLLGGPQAGIIAGRADLVDACMRHPLARALRPGGLVLGALQDTALPAGTRLRVEGLGDGVYERWERKTFGANVHFVDFGDGAQQVALRGLAPSQWSVLPPLAACVTRVRSSVQSSKQPLPRE